jgi:hypothetical protein
MATFAYDEVGVYPGQLIVGEDGMRSAFSAGLALREVEPFFPASEGE